MSTLINFIQINWLKIMIFWGKDIFQTGVQGSEGGIRSGAFRRRGGSDWGIEVDPSNSEGSGVTGTVVSG